MSKARAEIEITASSSKLAAGLNAARARFSSFASSIARGTSSTMRGAMTTLSKIKLPATASRAVGNFAGDMMTRGLDAVVSAGKGVVDFNRDLTRLGIAANRTPEQMDEIGQAIRRVSKETAVSSDEILKGTANYVALTGDFNGATKAMSQFARISQASGAKVDEVAQATAALTQAMKLDPADIEAAFSAMIVQGKAGAVEIKDFAGELAELAPQFAQFKGGQGLGGIREMGAAFQIIRQGAGSASGAATQFQALMGELVASHKELGAIGVKVFEKDGKSLRNFAAIMQDIAKNKALDKASKVSDIFGRKESQAAIRTIRSQIGAMSDLTKAGEDTGAVQRDLTTYLESTAGRLDASLNTVKERVAEAFTPDAIETFADILEKAAEAIGFVIEGLGDIKNHLTGKTSEAQNPYEAKAEDQESSLGTRFISGLSGGGGIVEQIDKQAQATMTNAAMAGAGNDPNAPGFMKRFEANRSGFNKQWGEIGEAGSRKKQQAAAARAAFGGHYGLVDNTEAGGEGRERAGLRYLATENLSSDKMQALIEAVKQEAEGRKEFVGKLANIAADFKSGMTAPTVQIGDNQVARSAKKSTDPWRSP